MTLRCLNRKIIGKCVSMRLYSIEKGQNITTAGVVVIGDEILKGEVQDTNSTFLAKELHKLGLKLKKISVIADNVRDISDEVRHFSKAFNYVLTTGGIGPTHDDLTYEGVALAFDEPLIVHPELKEICSRFYLTKDPLGAGMKLAFVPKSVKLHYLTTAGGRLPFPNVSVKNVYMFPGVPQLLRRTMIEAGPLLFCSKTKFFTKNLYFNLPEHEIIDELKQLIAEFPDVQFGCYPELFNSLYKAKVTVESCNEEATNKAYSRLIQLVPTGSIVDRTDDI